MDESTTMWLDAMLEQYRMHLRGEGGMSAEQILAQPQAAQCDQLQRKLKWTKRLIGLGQASSKNEKSTGGITSGAAKIIR